MTAQTDLFSPGRPRQGVRKNADEGQRRKDAGISRGLDAQPTPAMLLEPIVLELARSAGRYGIIADDVRDAAARRGIAPENPKDEQRAWSFLAGLFRRLVRRGDLFIAGERPSARPEANGNKLCVYVHREWVERGTA